VSSEGFELGEHDVLSPEDASGADAVGSGKSIGTIEYYDDINKL
jgi:hypothetical protein